MQFGNSKKGSQENSSYDLSPDEVSHARTFWKTENSSAKHGRRSSLRRRLSSLKTTLTRHQFNLLRTHLSTKFTQSFQCSNWARRIWLIVVDLLVLSRCLMFVETVLESRSNFFIFSWEKLWSIPKKWLKPRRRTVLVEYHQALWRILCTKCPLISSTFLLHLWKLLAALLWKPMQFYLKWYLVRRKSCLRHHSNPARHSVSDNLEQLTLE